MLIDVVINQTKYYPRVSAVWLYLPEPDRRSASIFTIANLKCLPWPAQPFHIFHYTTPTHSYYMTTCSQSSYNSITQTSRGTHPHSVPKDSASLPYKINPCFTYSYFQRIPTSCSTFLILNSKSLFHTSDLRFQ